MKVSCFTFIRNGASLGYPFVESIRSALPICDEFVIAVGQSEDDTRKLIEKIGDKKIRIIDTVWNENQRQSGFVYAQQKMIAWYNCTGDWAFYLEGDEVIHEKDYETIREAMEKNLDDPKVEVLAFHYNHFYGNQGTLGMSPAWYRAEARIIKNSLRAIALDGLHFTVIVNNKKGRWPVGRKINASIYHYGYVRSVEKMRVKLQKASKYWSSDSKFTSYANVDDRALGKFNGTHPEIMKSWLATHAQKEFIINPEYKISKRERRHRISMILEKFFNKDFSKRHWKEIK